MKKKLKPSFATELTLQQIGQNIRTARLRRGETESALADSLGVARATIARLERGDGGVSAALLLEALGHYGFGAQTEGLGDPDTDGVGKRLEAQRRPERGSRRAAGTRRPVDPRLL
ncbi:transcriptional regulator [Bordetella genomosp. 5]|uniref:helix-turn-helix domain-containing protein n=1 Tax=Bordetella genomosp. 5 TaxID=1395608 RepID=UPI000B9E1E0D|nr:helix-turn-helix transcriptional regulator [Bordetella genomosp. 5]OZI44693.1 transcriptional regulator [Bordetella genomosp. 5]